MTLLRLVAAVLLLLVIASAPPAKAQFADQATYAGTAGGTANAQTITVNNVSTISDVQGVLLKWVPVAANTASTTLAVSGTAATIIRKPGQTGLVALAVGELQVGQPVITMYDGTEHVLLSAINDTVNAAILGNSALAFTAPVNLQLNATVATNQLTIAVKGNNGSDPSATNPVLIPFRDVTIANGDPVIRSLQTALSFTINSGNTMGCVNAQMCRLWIIAIDNAGTVALCAYNATSAPAGVFTSVVGLNEANLSTSQAGTNGGSSAQLLYCGTSAVTAKPIRYIGYVEIQETTAGTWATGPTYTQLSGPGTLRPGSVVQDIYATSATQTIGGSGSTQAPTVPAASITPTSAANFIRATAVGSITQNTTGSPEVQMYRAVGGSAACTTAFGSLNISNVGSNLTFPVTSSGVDVPNSTGQRTYAVCILNSNAGQNVTYCSSSIAQSCTIELQEIMGALEPANNNALLREVG